MTIDEVVARLGGLHNGNARCPAHDDQTPSLSVTEGDDGRVLLRCHAGCSVNAICAALGITIRDLFPPRDVSPSEVARYTYTDDARRAVFDVVRRFPKSFHLEPANGKRGKGAMSGVPLVPYRLPDVIDAVRDGLPVFVVEGEKDADRLARDGYCATCNPMGAGKWAKVAEPARRALNGAHVVVVADRDRAGYAHAAEVARSLRDVAASLKVVEPAAGKDVSDHLAHGLGVESLVMVNAEGDGGDDPHGITTVNLGDVQPEAVQWLWTGRLVLGKLVLLDGDPSVGKSTVMLDLTARVTVGGTMPDGEAVLEPSDVVLMSAEDGLADTVRPRVDAAGGDPRRVHCITTVTARNADGDEYQRWPMLPTDVALLERLVRHTHARLVIVDVFMAYLDGNVNAYRDQDVRLALAPLAAMAERTGCCVVLLRHLRKSGGTSAVVAGGGSIGIIGAARLALMAAFDPDDSDVPDTNDRRRVLAVAKCNIARMAPSLSYRIVDAHGVGRIEWLGEVGHRADDLVDRDAQRDDERHDREAFLRDLLGDGPVPFADVERAAKPTGWSMKQLRTTLKKHLGGTITKSSYGGPWMWALPTPEDDRQDDQDAHIHTRAPWSPSGHLGEGDGAPEWEVF